MKELKNKEIIIGLIALIVLSVVAICLILRREFPREEGASPKTAAEETALNEQAVSEDDENNDMDIANAAIINQNLGIKDEETPDKPVVISNNEKAEIALFEEQKAGEYYSNPVLKEYTGDDMWQLEEIYYYWDIYKLEAVEDLICLPRVRTITNELSGTNYFYYYGSTDNKGNPNGKGIAVYADNAYYFGDWKDGKRSGRGMYWKIYPDKTGMLNNVPGVTEHIYNGEWLNDLPNGEGQEHISYDCDIMDGEYVINNVIGNFKDGYYDGELYIMEIKGEHNTTDWEATANMGVFDYCGETRSASGRRKVWKRMKESDEYGDDNFAWLFEEENTGFGVYGLKKAP